MRSGDIFTLTDGTVTARIMAYGARVVGIEAPDRGGHKTNVVLGYDDLAAYEDDTAYTGAVVGRYCNRIADGRFSLDGTTFTVPANSDGNALHGGPVGFDRKVWAARHVSRGVEMTLVSPDGDMGFPGELTTRVVYTIADKTLRIDYSATTTKPTVVSLTNHAYFNLAGKDAEDFAGHVLMLAADHYTPVDARLIPTGELAAVAGTPLDFRAPKPLRQAYDHNFVLRPGAGYAAEVFEPKSGRIMTVRTTEPGVQLYTGNPRGFCLETQHFPDSPNRPSFPSTVLRPGATLRSTTELHFDVRAT